LEDAPHPHDYNSDRAHEAREAAGSRIIWRFQFEANLLLESSPILTYDDTDIQ
jgi:hypothetical protein